MDDHSEVERLRASNAELSGRLQMLQMGLASYQEALEKAIPGLQREIDTMRFLTRYNRRTHFMVMGYVTFTVATLYSLSTQYDAVWWALVFPLVSHAGGPEWLEAILRVVGVLAQLGWIARLYRRSQVPSWLEHRVTKLALTEQDYLQKWPIEEDEDEDEDET